VVRDRFGASSARISHTNHSKIGAGRTTSTDATPSFTAARHTTVSWSTLQIPACTSPDPGSSFAAASQAAVGWISLRSLCSSQAAGNPELSGQAAKSGRRSKNIHSSRWNTLVEGHFYHRYLPLLTSRLILWLILSIQTCSYQPTCKETINFENTSFDCFSTTFTV
jgi:hypothetical protein